MNARLLFLGAAILLLSAVPAKAQVDIDDYADDLEEPHVDALKANPFSVLEDVFQEFMGVSEAPMMKMVREVQQTVTWLKKWVNYCIRQVIKVLPEPFKSMAAKFIPKTYGKSARRA